MADILGELRNASEILENQNITLSKAHNVMNTYTKQIDSFNDCPGKHSVLPQSAEKKFFKVN